jgi:hypothetical protein
VKVAVRVGVGTTLVDVKVAVWVGVGTTLVGVNVAVAVPVLLGTALGVDVNVGVEICAAAGATRTTATMNASATAAKCAAPRRRAISSAPHRTNPSDDLTDLDLSGADKTVPRRRPGSAPTDPKACHRGLHTISTLPLGGEHRPPTRRYFSRGGATR